MAVDKNLFLHNFSVVAILKNEGPYVKEWLDYHLLAGVDHFYIYDNESPDNQKEILQPYIDAGVVTCTFYPGKARQYESYNDATQRFRFFNRYMAFIDGDEFIFPKSKPTIPEVLDEIFNDRPDAAALGANWYCFGSNFQETADYSRGVLERFTRREKNVNRHIKTIANPRKINLFINPHFALYFEGAGAIGENGENILGPFNDAGTAEKIVINHYLVKSKEEFAKKVNRGNADFVISGYTLESFEERDTNDEFDDGILKYRAARIENFSQMWGFENVLVNLINANQINYDRVFNALIRDLSPTFAKNIPIDFFQGKMETFLTCRAVSSYLKENAFDETAGKFFEEASLNAVCKTLFSTNQLADLRLLFGELPNILALDYPIAEEIRVGCIQILPQVMNFFRVNNLWKEFMELDYLRRFLEMI